MTPARSLAASVVALGFASTLTAPDPAFAAPAPCERAENYAAQSGAELLRIDKLEVRAGRPTTKPDRQHRDTESATERVSGAADRVLGADDPGTPNPDDSDTISEGIGMLGSAVLGGLTGPRTTSADDAADASGPNGSAQAGDSTVARRSPGHETAGTAALKPVGNGAAGGGPGDATADGSGGDGVTGKGSGGSTKVDDDPDGADQDRKRGNGSEDGPEAAGSAGDERGEAGKAASAGGFGLGETRTAMIGNASVNSAAFARVLDAKSGSKLANPLLQQAPPTNAKAAKRSTKAGTAGPLRVGAGELGTHAQWDAGMACGKTVGEAARSDAAVRGASLLGSSDGALMRVPGKLSSRSTTALERRGAETRTVAEATVTAGRIELAGGKVKVRMLQPPTLTATMSAAAGGRIDYRPAVIEVTGPGVNKRLSAAGDHVDVALTPDRHTTESSMLGSLKGLGAGTPMPIPAVPGLPQVTAPQGDAAPQTESASPAGKVRISLGAVRQATKGNAIAAKATAIHVSLLQPTASKGRGKPGYGGKPTPGASLTMAFGLLEAAAVSPEKSTGGESAGGAGGGLPVTGPQLQGLALTGGALLLAGVAAVLFGVRRRRTRS